MSSNAQRVRYIDGLRGIAVLGVVCCHAALALPAWASITNTSAGIPLYWLGHALVDGAHGVDLFFVLSGFCLAYPTLARARRDGAAPFDLVRFAAHRLVRIVPPYYGAIALFLVLGGLIWLHTGRLDFAEAGAVSASDLVRQLFFFDRETTFLNSNFWTLAVEFRWYFLFPLALLVWVRAPRAYLAAIAVVVVAYWQTRLYSIDLGVLPAFLLGIVAADVHLRRHPLCRYALPLACAALALGLALEPWSTMPLPNGVPTRSFYLQSNFGWHLAAFFFVVAAGSLGWLRDALGHPALVALGAASYSIYLVHTPFIALLAPHVIGRSPLLAFGALLGIGIATGFAFWFAVERWFVVPVWRDRWHRLVMPAIASGFRTLGLPPSIDVRPAGAPVPAAVAAVSLAQRGDQPVPVG